MVGEDAARFAAPRDAGFPAAGFFFGAARGALALAALPFLVGAAGRFFAAAVTVRYH